MGAAMRRGFGLVAFLPLASRMPVYAKLIWALVLDERTPGDRKAILAIALGYVLVGRDIIRDDIPLLGRLDDVIVVALAVDLFLDGVPRDLLEEKLEALDIDQVAFHDDIANIRRLTPGPVRRAARRIPDLIGFAGAAVHEIGLGPKLRGWIKKEG